MLDQKKTVNADLFAAKCENCNHYFDVLASFKDPEKTYLGLEVHGVCDLCKSNDDLVVEW